MKKTATLLLALGAVAAQAQAQTSVAIYGIADAAVVGESGGTGGHVTKIGSGAAAVSRLGLRGTENLGGGLSAFFTLEMGYRIDSGEIDSSGSIFNRQALVGLKGRLGAVALGRQYTPFHKTLANVVDPFGTGYAGTSKTLFPDWGSNVRTSNTITYAAPAVRGVDWELAYSAGEQAVSSAGRQYGGAVGYASGPLAVRLGYNSRNSDVAGAATTAAIDRSLGRNILLGANYNFGWIRPYVGYGMDKGYNSAALGNSGNPYGGVKATPSTDSRDMLIGFTAPLGIGTLMFSIMHKDDRTAFDQDASSIGIGYLYALSKQVGLYAAYAHLRNRNGAGYTVANNNDAGTGTMGYNLGLRYNF